MDKKQKQLGMNPSTASHRLVKDTLWRLVQELGYDTCVKCGLVMTRETFSIEHLVPWLDSDDPLFNFFNQENIAFSHLICNISDNRGPRKYLTEEERKSAKNKQNKKNRPYSPERRREQYKRTGK